MTDQEHLIQVVKHKFRERVGLKRKHIEQIMQLEFNHWVKNYGTEEELVNKCIELLRSRL